MYADPGGKQRDVEALSHGCRRALSEGVVGAIWLASGELDPSLKQGRSVSGRQVCAHRVARSRSPISIAMRPSNA